MDHFVFRFSLNIVPLMRPVHGLFYSISIHCRYHCPGLGEDDVAEMKTTYSSFLTALLSLMKSTKVLLKRLKYVIIPTIPVDIVSFLYSYVVSVL